MDREGVFSESRGSSTTEDMASLLLKGWSMLSETCSSCREVPLMRSREGVLKCCRCQCEKGATNVVCVADEPPSTSIGERNKYNIVDECGLESEMVRGIHCGEGGKSFSTVGECRRRVSGVFDDRRVKQLCLLKFELSVALDRYTRFLHTLNERVSSDVASEVGVLAVIERTLHLLDSVESKI